MIGGDLFRSKKQQQIFHWEIETLIIGTAETILMNWEKKEWRIFPSDLKLILRANSYPSINCYVSREM